MLTILNGPLGFILDWYIFINVTLGSYCYKKTFIISQVVIGTCLATNVHEAHNNNPLPVRLLMGLANFIPLYNRSDVMRGQRNTETQSRNEIQNLLTNTKP